VGTYREAEVRQNTVLDEQIARLARESSLHAIPLGPLTVEDVAQFLRRVAPETVDHEGLAADLHERSGGNPFFLSQLVALKKQQSDRGDWTSAPSAHPGLPTALRSAVVSHLASIPSATRRLLSVAAVIGREFDLSILSAAAGQQLDQIHATLEPALSSGLVSKHTEVSGAFRFSHVLLRDALYDSLRSPQRASLHSAVGGALERIHSDDLAPHASQLAYHFSQASGSEAADKTVLYSTRAGEWSTECHAYEDAPRHFQAALLTASREGRKSSKHRCEMEIRLAEAWLAAGRSDLARTTVESASSVARRLGNPNLFARSALVLAPGFFATQVGLYDPLIVSLLEEAIAGKDLLDPGPRAQLLARLAIALVWSDSEARRESLTREALETARQSADAEALVYALCARHGVLWEPNRRSEREAVIDELGNAARSLRKPEFALIYRLFRITNLLEQGDVAAIDYEIAVFTRIAEDLRLPHFLWQAKLLDATRNLMAGRFRKAEKLAEEFFTLGHRAEQQNTLHCFAAHLAIHRWEQGRSAEIMHGIEELVEQYPAVYAWRAVRAFLLTEVGQFDAARAQVEGIASRGLQNLPKNETWMMSLNLLAEVCVRLGDVQRSGQLYDLLLPTAGSHAVLGFGVAFWGSLARALGLLARALERWSKAEFHFEVALRQNERAGALPWIAHTHHDYAQMLLSRALPGDSYRAQAHAKAALTIARSIGMANLEEKARRTMEAQ
jgi:tetratricopeptide (TPR) repeat protein